MGKDISNDSNHGSVDKKALRKSSDDGRYLFINDKDKLTSIQSHESSTTPLTLGCCQDQGVASKSKGFGEFSGFRNVSPTTLSPLSESSKSNLTHQDKCKEQKVSKVCVILNDAELLVVSIYYLTNLS
jgi:hypothetical protein